MKASDAVVGNFYVVKKEPPTYSWSKVGTGGSKKSELNVNDILKCTSKTPAVVYRDPAKSTYDVITGMLAGTSITVTSHAFLSPESDAATIAGDRSTRQKTLARIITEQKERLASLKEQVNDIETKLAANTAKLEKLVAYPTDEAELAHMLAEVVRSGGSEEKILEALLKMTDAGGNAVKKMVNKAEAKTNGKSPGISTLLEY